MKMAVPFTGWWVEAYRAGGAGGLGAPVMRSLWNLLGL